MRSVGRWLLWTFALATAALLLLQGWYAVHIWWWRDHPPRETAFMAMRLSDIRTEHPEAHLAYTWVPYERISIELKRAMIAAEDARFVEHEGFDWDGIEQALDRNARRGRIVAGGSTITQQLAKNLFLSSQRSYWRKSEEALITLMLEAVLDKRRILELYLNVSEWGIGVFGIEAAARHYYAEDAAAISAGQGARLAAMLPRPQFYDKNRGSAYLAAYAARIEGRMGDSQVP